VNILASPIRYCVWSRKKFPKGPVTSVEKPEEMTDCLFALDFLVTFRAGALSEGSSEQYLVPSRILKDSHKVGKGCSVMCRREVVEAITTTKGPSLPLLFVTLHLSLMRMWRSGPHLGAVPRASISPLLPKQTASQLRQRVFQELSSYCTSLLSGEDTNQSTPAQAQIPAPYRLSPTEIDSIDRTGECGRFAFSNNRSSSSGDDDDHSHPAAILSFRDDDDGSHHGFSRLLHAAPRSEFDTRLLAPHLIPRYNTRSLFFPPDLSDIEREVTAGEEMFEKAKRMLGQVGVGGEDGVDVWAIKADRATLGFLISLWRWRLWVGEGWQLDHPGPGPEDSGTPDGS
jgi:hypothetical protein